MKKPQPKTTTARQADYRARQRAQGFELVQLWVQPEHRQELIDLAERLRKRWTREKLAS